MMAMMLRVEYAQQPAEQNFIESRG